MNYYSTNKKSPVTNFKTAVITSLPSDKGLYFPESIPALSKAKIESLKGASLPEIGFEMMKSFVVPDISEEALKAIMEDVLSFDIPLVQVDNDIQSLELYHGPTYAFKDVGARFLARCLGEFAKDGKKKTTILVATSGDTGGAVADGFYGVEGVRVVILYPSGKVSDLQEKQLTTLGGNITALEVNGDFDNCQTLVKQAFLDSELNEKLNLTSANSINIARWMPQSIYYAWMSLQLENPKETLISVPSGNYGNVTAGMLAKRLGFPLGDFLVCANENDVVPRYLKSSLYEPKDTVVTYANAMDVNDPSNFPRMLTLYNDSYDELSNEITGFKLTDEEILFTIKSCKEDTTYVLDPHGAIAYAGLKRHLKEGQKGVFLETAHPIKFAPIMAKALGKELPLPDFAQELMTKQKSAERIEKGFEFFKRFLLNQ